MKKICLLLVFTAIICNSYSQQNNYDLPSEFKNVAIKAFQQVSPATKQWFVDAAKQHPSGPFDTLWARKKLKEKFSTAEINRTGKLFMVMIAYQRMMTNEARQNSKMATTNKQLQLTGRENKLNIDKEKIDQQKKEAKEKADNEMNAAQVNLWMGIVSGSSAMTGNNNGQSNQKITPVHLSPGLIQKNDSSKMKTKNSDLSKQAQKEEEDEKRSDEDKKASEDHEKAIKDAIKKLMDEIEEMRKHSKF